MARPTPTSAALASIAMIAGCACVLSASAQPRREARGRLDLTYTIFERGVSHVSAVHYRLEAELSRGRARRVELHVLGELERRSAFLEPPDGVRDQGTVRLAIDQTHGGEIVSEDASGLTVRFDPEARGEVLEWRCDRARERVGERPLDLLRCALSTPLTALPWSDPAPAYLRATMVLAIGGASVRAHVSATPEHGSHVQLLPAR